MVMHKKVFNTKSSEQTVKIGQRIGQNLRGGEVIELASDLGGGKTTFTRGLAKGFGSDDPVASPTFVINFIYSRPDGKQLWHFDFYRLTEPGVVAHELAEAEADSNNVLVVEWGEIVHDVLPAERVRMHIATTGDEDREITCEYPEDLNYLFSGVSS